MNTNTRTLTRALACLSLAAAPWAVAAQAVDVTVANGQVMVSQSTVGAGATSITWVLKTPGYVFANPAIAIDGRAPYTCAAENATQVRCDKSSRASGGNYAYTVSVRPAGNSRSGTTLVGTNVWIAAD